MFDRVLVVLQLITKPYHCAVFERVLVVLQLIIKPYHYAVFTVNIVAPQEEGAYAAEVWMFTQFEVSILAERVVLLLPLAKYLTVLCC